MLTITSPDKINFIKKGENLAEVTIEPCYPGFGVTIGNSLRRVLLSSLDGAAITGFKIIGVDHEFSAVKSVKEDVVEIILNLKKLRLKIYEQTDEDIKLTLNVKGKKVVTAGDITSDSRVEILNKDLHIATVTEDKGNLEMELFARSGRGYVTVEQRESEKLEIGTIAIDALFSPVVNVGFRIENTRVGEMTNYEKIIMNLETDGSLTPEEALAKSAEVLVKQFMVFSKEISMDTITTDESMEESDDQVDDQEGVDEKIEELDDKPSKKRGRPKKSDK